MNAQASNPLDGVWTLTEVAGLDMTDLPQMVFEFAGDRLYGNGPCNSFQTGILVDSDTVEILPFEMGNKVCSPDLMAAEYRFLDALQRVRSYRVAGGTLTLNGAGATLVKAQRG